MEKRFKKGVTLVEILCAILIFSIAVISFIYVEMHNYKVAIKIENKLDQTLFLDNCYELFSIDPINFKTNLEEAYKGKWVNSIYYPEILTKYEVRHYETDEFIHIFILEEGKVLEEWVRKKVTL